MNLTDAKSLALALMQEHGLITWRFTFDNAKRRLGLIRFNDKTISMSETLTSLNPIEQVRNTILHEIAHALVGPSQGHNRVWRDKAISIGCNGNRMTNSIVKVEYKYTVTCGVCRESWGCHRRPRYLVNGWHKPCGRVSMNRLTITEGE